MSRLGGLGEQMLASHRVVPVVRWFGFLLLLFFTMQRHTFKVRIQPVKTQNIHVRTLHTDWLADAACVAPKHQRLDLIKSFEGSIPT